MADDSEQVGQDEIEALLRQAQGGDNPPPEPKPEPRQKKQDENVQVDQAEIEALLSGGSSSPPLASTAGVSPAAAASLPGDPSVSQSDIELLLSKAEEALGSIDQPEPQTLLPPGIKSFEFERFGGTTANTESATLELMRDVQLDMTIELGRTHMQLEDILKLKQGAVVPLDKLAGDPADIFVNGRLVARGEVLVLNDNFCVRVAELIEGENAVA